MSKNERLITLSFSIFLAISTTTAATVYAQQPRDVTLDSRLEISNDTERFIKDYLKYVIEHQLSNSMSIQITPSGTMFLYSNGGTPANPSDDISIVIARTEMSVENGYKFSGNAIYAPNGTRILPATSTITEDIGTNLNLNTDDYDATADD